MGSLTAGRKAKRCAENASPNGSTKRKRPQMPSPHIQPRLLNVLTGNDTRQTDDAESFGQNPNVRASEKKADEIGKQNGGGEVAQLHSATKSSGTSSLGEETGDAGGDKSDHLGTLEAPDPHPTADSAQNVRAEPMHGKLPHPLPVDHAKKIKVTVLLENANLETVKQNGRGGGFVLLNCDDHRHLLHKTGRNANDARPDITHQCLLTLLDSPLNKEGRLKVYIRTAKNVLIDVHPETRIPRTMKRFSGLMAELLEKLKVRGTTGSTPLLKVIRNPIASHLPVGTRKIVCTYNTENVVDIREHALNVAAMVLPAKQRELHEEFNVAQHGEEVNVLYVVGAMAHGKVVEDWADEYICISEYPLSAANVCGRITYAYENLFGIM